MEDKAFDQILNILDSTQKEWIQFSEDLMKHAKSKGKQIHYADLKDIFLFMKIAELKNNIHIQSHEINILREWKLNKEGI